MNADIRSNIRLRWLESLYELSHLNFQHELWIEAKHSEIIGNFDEAICKYFDDLNLNEGYQNLNLGNSQIFELTEQQAISTFHHELSNYLDKPEKRTLSDSKVLKDPDWQKLTELGLTAWNEVKQLLTETAELALTEALESKYGK